MKRVPIQLYQSARQRGVAAMPIIVAVIIIVVFAVAAWFLIFRPGTDEQVIVPAVQQANTAAAPSTVAPPPNVGAMGVDQLLGEAKKAMNDGRIIAPQGNNAFEFYLMVLEQESDNPVARSALRETFPFAASAVERDINANSFDEAQREIGLLTQADPGNYTLTILRSKLDAQRKLAARAEEQAKLAEQQRLRAEQLAAEQAAAEAQAETQTAQQQPERQATPAEVQPQQPLTPVVEQPPPVPEPEPEQELGPTRGPVLVKQVDPIFPRVALRRRVQGWVIVGYKVDTEGNIIDTRVIDADRARFFRRPALEAIQQWEYRPALENGKPVVSEELTRKFNFTL